MGASHTRSNDEKMNNCTSNTEENVGDSRASSSSSRPLSIEGGAQSASTSMQSTLQPVENQPRQPTDLQGLLRFAMEATCSKDTPQESSFHALNQERKEFLNEALSSLSVNVIEELQKAIKTLSNFIDIRPDDDSSEQEAALERIADYVDNIDIANDFYKIGGFAILGPCLNSPHSGIRWRTADIIAELAQNNPFCQERILETGLFPILLHMIDLDSSDAARIKALYAISCIVRGHPMSLRYMDVNDGYSVLLRAIQSSVEKLQIKSAFLLSSLCNKENSNDLKITLVNMGLVEQVAGLLAVAGNLLPEIREQLLGILYGLTNDGFLPALQECRRAELGLKLTLEQCMKELIPIESVDELDTCRRLLNKVFSDQESNQER